MSELTIVQALVGATRSRRSYVRGGPYPVQFRRDVARLIQEGQTDARKLSAVLGVKPRTIQRWVTAECGSAMERRADVELSRPPP